MDADLLDQGISLKQIFSTYKYAVILVGFGLILTLFGLRLLLSDRHSPKVEIMSATNASVLPQLMYIHVAGAVNDPGVYELSLGSRVNDALEAAGGLSQNADDEWVAQHVNLAEELVDGAKIYIPTHEEVEAQAADTDVPDFVGLNSLSSNSSKHTNINTATASELDTLPGIGPVTAEKIIANRPYTSIDELLNKKAVNKGQFEKIKEMVSVN